jgi:hypothetical protein
MNNMKCPCGYEIDHDIVNDHYIQTKGDDRFIRVNILATINDGGWDDKLVKIYACPKCGALQIER